LLIGDVAIEEEKWKTVSRMLDSMMLETDISQRLTENAALQRSIEKWWINSGGSATKGVAEEVYKHLHLTLYGELLQANDVSLHGIIAKAIHSDWQIDSDGKSELSFGDFSMSILELVDNWVPNCDGDAYAAFLEKKLQVLFPPIASAPPPFPMTWEEKTAFLSRNARLYSNPRLITIRKTQRYTPEYYAVPSRDSK
jgi:hypothetical protein